MVIKELNREVIVTSKAPNPMGPYSQAVRVGSLLFISGQGSIDPETGAPIPGDIQTETARTLENLNRILEEAGSSLGDVVAVTVYLRDVSLYAAMNETYRQYFPEHPPARTCLGGVDVPGGLQIELNAIAAIGT